MSDPVLPNFRLGSINSWTTYCSLSINMIMMMITIVIMMIDLNFLMKMACLQKLADDRDAALMAGIGSSRTQPLRHVSALNYGWMEPRLRFELDCCKCLDKKAVCLVGDGGIIRG